MDMQRAQELLSLLADGVDPFTGELLPEQHVCNRPDIIRALHTVLSAVTQAEEKAKKAGPANAGKPWTEEEQTKLREEFQSGMKMSEIARAHERTRGSIEAKLAYLGLISESYFYRK